MVSTFDTAIVTRLLKSFNENKFESELFTVLSEVVPRVCASKLNTNPEEDYALAYEEIFKPLEWFICGGKSLEQVKTSLDSIQKASSFCGHIFKPKEPMYICRDCGVYPTCVLCQSCFEHSSHVKHNFKMGFSQGGGYCDCGDVEAWKKDPWCQHHLALKETHDSESSSTLAVTEEEREAARLAAIPEDLRQRTELLIRTLLDLTDSLLMWTVEESLVSPFTCSTTDDYAVVFYNDEFHSFDQVIRTLMRVFELDNPTATSFTAAVDRDGRSVVQYGNRESTLENVSIVKEYSTQLTSSPIECRSLHLDILAFQSWACKVFCWLPELVERLEGLRPVVCRILFQPLKDVSTAEESIVVRMFHQHSTLWRRPRRDVLNCFKSVIFRDAYYKKFFAESFAQHYETILSSYTMDDHHDVDSMNILTLQLFTYMAHDLLEKHNLFYRLMTFINNGITIYTESLSTSRPDEKVIKHRIKQDEKVPKFKRLFAIFSDLKYLLLGLKTNFQLILKSEVSMQNFLLYINALSNFIIMVQDMTQVKHVTDVHIALEPNWTAGFNAMLRLLDVIQLSVDIASSDSDLLNSVLQIVSKAYCSRVYSFDNQKVVKFKCFGHISQVVDYDVAKNAISVIQILPRLITALLNSAHKYPEIVPQFFSTLSPSVIMERSLQIIVFQSQVMANFWIRNGTSVKEMVLHLNNVYFRKHMLDKDIQLLQHVAANNYAEQVLLSMIHKFNLKDYFKKSSSLDTDTLKLKVQLVEDFFRNILLLVSERHEIGVGVGVTPELVLQHEIIHVLCQGPLTHSELIQSLDSSLYDNNLDSMVNSIVDDIADRVQVGQTTHFQVKPSLIKRFNRFHFHYQQSQGNKAEQWVRRQLKKDSLDLALPPPFNIAFTTTFNPVLDILRCDVFLSLVTLFLDIVIKRSSIVWWSENSVDLVLHCIGVALHEDIRESRKSGKFPFLSHLDMQGKGSNSNKGLLAHLELLADRSCHEEQHDLIRWTLRRCNEAIQLREQTVVVSASGDPAQVEALQGIQSIKTLKVDGGDDNELAKDQTEDKTKRQLQAEAARKRREKVMENMSQMQRKFMQSTTASNELDVELPATPLIESSPLAKIQKNSFINASEEVVHKVVGHGRSIKQMREQKLVCIHCKEEVEECLNSQPMVMAGNGVRSTLLAMSYEQNQQQFTKATMDHKEGTFIGVCIHMMHLVCKKKYEQQFRRAHGNVETRCPVCKFWTNLDVLIVPPITSMLPAKSSAEQLAIDIPFDDWLNMLTVWYTANERNIVKFEFLTRIEELEKLLGPTEQVANLTLLYNQPDKSLRSHPTVEMKKSKVLWQFADDLEKRGYQNLDLASSVGTVEARLNAMRHDLAYTITCWEKILRNENRSFFNGLPERFESGLAYIVRSCVLTHTISGACTSEVIRNTLQLLGTLFSERMGCSVLETDFFFMLVSLTLLRPTFFADMPEKESTELELNLGNMSRLPIGDIIESHVLKLCVTGHLVQVILGAQSEQLESMGSLSHESPAEEMLVESEEILEIYQHLRVASGVCEDAIPSPRSLTRYLRDALLPFLRCASFFYYNLSMVDPPKELCFKDGVSMCADRELVLLMRYLDLPLNLCNLLERSGEKLKQLMASWCLDERVGATFSQAKHDTLSKITPARLIIHPLPVPKLVDLPQHFTDLRALSRSYSCSGINSDLYPALCLICGEVYCFQGYCCRQLDSKGDTICGAQVHARKCHAGYALMLCLPVCKVVIYSDQAMRVTIQEAPYRDQYRETDPGLKRGNPLYLDNAAYQRLTQQWMSHSLVYNSVGKIQ